MKGGLSEKDKMLAKMLAKGNKKLAKRIQMENKYGKGKITKQGNDDTTDRKKADVIIPKVPGQQVGYTEGVTNVMGVYRWNNELREERTGRHEHHREQENRKEKEQEAKIIEKAAKKKADKAKKKRMKANNGVDPDELLPTRAQIIRGEQKKKKALSHHHRRHHHHHHHHRDGEDRDGEGSDSDMYSSDNDSDSDDSIDGMFNSSNPNIRLEFQQSAKDAKSEAELLAIEFKRQAGETKQMLKRMGYRSSTKICTACGSRTPNRPIDYWTGKAKGGHENQWYGVGDQNFCYPCAHNGVLMMGVAKGEMKRVSSRRDESGSYSSSMCLTGSEATSQDTRTFTCRLPMQDHHSASLLVNRRNMLLTRRFTPHWLNLRSSQPWLS